MCILVCNLFFRIYDYCVYCINKYNDECREEQEMLSLLNENPYYALE